MRNRFISHNAMIVGPYLQAPSDQSMTIMWITKKQCVGWVEYGPDPALGVCVSPQKNGLKDVGNIHTVKLTGLSPGTTCYYKIYSKVVKKILPYDVKFGKIHANTIHKFKTLDTSKTKFSFLVFNDTHGKQDIYSSFLNFNGLEAYDLVFLNGDTLSHVDSEKQVIKKLLIPVSALFAKEIPFLYIRGNHETRSTFARTLPDYFTSPNGRKFYYALDHGPVHFTILDAGEDKEDQHGEYSGLVDFKTYRNEVTQWLREEIQSPAFKNAHFNVVFMHLPVNDYINYGGHRKSENSPEPIPDHLAYLKEWEQMLHGNKIDVFLAGHTHIYEIYPPTLSRDYPIIIGGGPSEREQAFIRVNVDTSKGLEVKIITLKNKTQEKIVGAYSTGKKRIDSKNSTK